MKTFKNRSVLDYKGEPIPRQRLDDNQKIVDEGEVSVINVMWTILNNAPLKTQDDSIQGARLAEALTKAKDTDVIELEEGVHDWLKPIAEKLTPQLFRINGNVIYKFILEGFEKPHDPEKTE